MAPDDLDESVRERARAVLSAYRKEREADPVREAVQVVRSAVDTGRPYRKPVECRELWGDVCADVAVLASSVAAAMHVSEALRREVPEAVAARRVSVLVTNAPIDDAEEEENGRRAHWPVTADRLVCYAPPSAARGAWLQLRAAAASRQSSYVEFDNGGRVYFRTLIVQ
ncbi:hypothetical protein CDCA_CDCA16G4246 [Cyanidium caldarium]|uniref:Uncharacterized protein n=1 Tax=Cyanidium caldarium TaxID=2771 RepID=A0AAV9J1H4_CYACA|nr:hypothetical protein CDCA_CDCA16G4246 [Cyanidium caldarium]